MIAWGSSTPPGIEIALGEWVIQQVDHRVDFPEIRKCDFSAVPAVVKGFRTPPLNPGKRIKSCKPKRKRKS